MLFLLGCLHNGILVPKLHDQRGLFKGVRLDGLSAPKNAIGENVAPQGVQYSYIPAKLSITTRRKYASLVP